MYVYQLFPDEASTPSVSSSTNKTSFASIHMPVKCTAQKGFEVDECNRRCKMAMFESVTQTNVENFKRRNI